MTSIVKKIIHKLYPIFECFFYKIVTLQANIITYLYKNNYSKYNEIQGDVDPLSKQIICVFSHFSYDNKIADYVVSYIKALYEVNCAIILVSSSQNIDQASIALVKPYVSSLVIRPNVGRDFGSFCCGYKIAKKYNHHEFLIFANDSVYGPFYPLNHIFDSIRKQDCDVIGMTDSWQKGYHLQSYFLVFTKKVLASKVLDSFFDNFKFNNNKTYIIHKYEIGLSLLLIKNDFNLKALYNYFDVAESFYDEVSYKNTVNYQNSTHKFWRTLIQKYKFPFLKRELILLNPSKVHDLYLWKSTINETDYDVSLIENHIKKFSIK